MKLINTTMAMACLLMALIFSSAEAKTGCENIPHCENIPQEINPKKERPRETHHRRSHTDTINFLYFNDFHGSFQEDGKTPGAARLVAQIETLKDSLPNVIVLCGGDNYSGGFFPRLTGGKPLAEMFELCQVEYSALGNHEFDWGIPAMTERLKWGKTQYLVANIFLDSTRNIRPEWACPYILQKRQLKNGGQVRLAIIGLSTQETKTAALPSIVKDLQFADPVNIANNLARQLKDSADLILLLTHIGSSQDSQGNVSFTDEGVDALSQIKDIDGIFTGHSHNEVCGLKDNIPVVQARNYGRKLALVQFEITQDRKGNIQQRFLQSQILNIGKRQNQEMQMIVDEYLNMPEFRFQETICNNLTELNPLDPVKPGEFTYLGALVTQSYANCYREMHPEDSLEIVIGVCNVGAIRTILPQGRVTRLQAGNIIPFGGVLNAFEFNGKELMALLQSGIDCKAGWLQYHQMDIEIENNKITKAYYLPGSDPDTRIEIVPEGRYIVVTENFLSSGGDGYNPKLFHKKIEKFNIETPEHMAKRNPTDAFIHYLHKLGTIDTLQIQVPRCRIL